MTFLISIIIVISSFSCRKETPPEPSPGPTIELVAEDVGVTEAWLRVRFTDSGTPRSFVLTREDSLILSVSDSPADTLIIDTSLAPNRSYSYKAYRLTNGQPVDSTAGLVVQTMDTTSHDFTWQIDTLGDGNSSVLYNVAIVNDTCVWAVGQIYLRDSIGQFEPPYNVVRWDGTTWNLIRLDFPQYNFDCTIAFYSSVLAVAVHSFSPDNVIFTDGAAVARWNGTSFSYYPCVYSAAPSAMMTRFWGASSSSFYGVGREGLVVYYDGGVWQRIETGTTLDVYDIWGEWNTGTSDHDVYAVAGKLGVNFEKKIFRVFPTSVTELPDSGIPYSIHGIWFKPERHYFVVGDGMYSKPSIAAAGPWQWLHPGVTPYYIYGVRGTNLNDIFACGSFGEMLHFNGVTWRSFRTNTAIAQGSYRSLDVRGNLVVAVGYEYPRAIVARGTR